MMHHLTLVTSLLLVLSNAYVFEDDETATKADYVANKIDLHICVKDESSGKEVSSSSVTAVSWSGGTETVTQGSLTRRGCFDLKDIPRGAIHVNIEAPNYYSSITPIDLHIPTRITNVNLGSIMLTKKRDGVARLVFGGDVMFDRRFFNSLLNLEGNLIANETMSLFRYIRPFLEAGDHTNVNLECPFVEDRSTPHPSKKILFGCHRDSAEALPKVGIDSVTIGNNHLYDYLEIGTQETMDILDDVGMQWFGGGMTRQEARDSRRRFGISGTGTDPVPISLQGFTSYYDYIQGDEYTTFADINPDKGGAMPAFREELKDFVQGEIEAGRIPIPIIHGGEKYRLMQDSDMRTDFETSALAGAELVVAHHPHVVHGVSTFQTTPEADPVFVLGSLGNLVFDHNIHETFPGYLAVVDMNASGHVERLELVPIVLEGYVPRPVSQNGDKASSSAMGRTVRRIAHMSTAEALRGVKASVACSVKEGSSVWVKATTCGFGGAVPFIENGKILVAASEGEVRKVDTTTQHVLELSPSVTSPQIIAVHEHHHDTSSLVALEAKELTSLSNVTCELGVDLLRIGGFETETAGQHGPEDYPLPTLWETSNYRYIQSTRTRSGTGAAVLVRSSTSKSRTSLYYDRKVEVIPGSKVTVRGFFAMENAGKFVAAVYFTDASGIARYTKGSSYTHNGGDVPGWTEFHINLDIPSDVVDIKAYLRHYPPEQGGEGRVFVDDLSFIQWDSQTVPVESSEAVNLVTPNGWEFVRCTQDGSDEMNLSIDITGRVYEERYVQAPSQLRKKSHKMKDPDRKTKMLRNKNP